MLATPCLRMLLSTFALLVSSAAVALAQGPKQVLNTTWQAEEATFNAWYAKEKGWDKEQGLEFKLHMFDSGMAQIEALPSKQWVLGGYRRRSHDARRLAA